VLKFVAMQNVKHFRTKLHNEVNPDRRVLLQRLLVEEEDRVGASSEVLAGVQRAIDDYTRQIAELTSIIKTLQIDGPGATVAKAQLETLTDSLELHKTYCRKLQSKLTRTVSNGPLPAPSPSMLVDERAARGLANIKRALAHIK
jgi:hypothetical protein